MYALVLAAPLGFAAVAVFFAIYAWRAYRAGQYGSMIARLICFGIAAWGANAMATIAYAIIDQI